MNGMQSTLHMGQLLRGQYRVVKLLGQGASGAVYLVADEQKQHHLFALKEVMHAFREGQRDIPFDVAALKQLDYPALPRIYQVFHGDNHDRFYILMDYVEGNSLEAMRQLMPGKRFSLHAAMMLMSPIMDAVSYLHRRRPPLVHGDIKPSNIILPGTSMASPSKLVDFGGGKNVDAGALVQEQTFNFRAPEQYGKSMSRRTDVYALGAIFYTLLAGTVPAAASDRQARIEAGEPDPLVPLSRFMPSAHIVSDAIHCALSFSRNDRYASVELFREALWQVIHTEPVMVQIPELPAAPPSREEHTGPDAAPVSTEAPGTTVVAPSRKHARQDAELPEVEIPGLIVRAIRQADLASVDASSASPLSPFVAGEGASQMKVSPREEAPVLIRKKRRLPARKRIARKFFQAVPVLLLVCILGSVVGVAGYQIFSATYQHEMSLAQSGLSHLQTAVSLLHSWSNNTFDASPVLRAQHEFATASASLAQLDTDLQAYAGVAPVIPGFGTRFSAASHVVPLALELSQAGIAGCDALNVIVTRFHEPLSVGRGLAVADLAVIGNDLHQVEVDVNQAVAQVNALQPADLRFDAYLGTAIAEFHHYLPSLLTLVHETDQLLPALPTLLGISAPAYYLVELLDTTELRPGGGLIKDYGFATLIGGRLSAAHISDAHLLDANFTHAGQTLPLPPAYRWFNQASTGWNLADSNLDADFPTAATYAEQNYSREHGRVDPQGVMAITPNLMANALAITGSISIPELHQTVTTRNLVDLIHYYQYGPGSHGQGGGILSPGEEVGGSRNFTELLAQHFLARLHQLPAFAFPKFLQVLITSLQTKDLQIYFNAPAAENLLQSYEVGATIQPSAGDSFFVVDANNSGNHVNQLITKALDDRVTIDGDGNATHHTTMRYAWVKNGNVFGPPIFSDYVRVYVPSGSSLREQQGWQPGGTSHAFGREVWAGSFTLSYGQTSTISLTWTAKGAAKKDAAGWHYQYLVQHQAGANWTLNVQVTVPSCAVNKSTGGLSRVRNGQAATLSQPLTKDTTMHIDYRC
jgi:serine/threonine protein kinase